VKKYLPALFVSVKREVGRWMRWFTWMAVLGPLGPPDIPQATPLPVAGKTPLSVLPQAVPLSARAGPAAHLPKRSMRLPCAKPPTAAQSSHHATHNLPELTTRRGGSPRDTQIKNKQVQVIHQWNANKYTSLSHQEPACKYSSHGIPEQSSTVSDAPHAFTPLLRESGGRMGPMTRNFSEHALRVPG